MSQGIIRLLDNTNIETHKILIEELKVAENLTSSHIKALSRNGDYDITDALLANPKAHKALLDSEIPLNVEQLRDIRNQAIGRINHKNPLDPTHELNVNDRNIMLKAQYQITTQQIGKLFKDIGNNLTISPTTKEKISIFLTDTTESIKDLKLQKKDETFVMQAIARVTEALTKGGSAVKNALNGLKKVFSDVKFNGLATNLKSMINSIGKNANIKANDVRNVENSFSEILKNAPRYLKEKGSVLLASFNTLMSKAGTAFMSSWNDISTKMLNFLEYAKNNSNGYKLQDSLEEVGQQIKNLSQKLNTNFKPTGEQIGAFVKTTIDKLKELEIPNHIKQPIFGILKNIKDISLKRYNYIAEKLSELYKKIKELINNAITKWNEWAKNSDNIMKKNVLKNPETPPFPPREINDLLKNPNHDYDELAKLAKTQPLTDNKITNISNNEITKTNIISLSKNRNISLSEEHISSILKFLDKNASSDVSKKFSDNLLHALLDNPKIQFTKAHKEFLKSKGYDIDFISIIKGSDNSKEINTLLTDGTKLTSDQIDYLIKKDWGAKSTETMDNLIKNHGENLSLEQMQGLLRLENSDLDKIDARYKLLEGTNSFNKLSDAEKSSVKEPLVDFYLNYNTTTKAKVLSDSQKYYLTSQQIDEFINKNIENSNIYVLMTYRGKELTPEHINKLLDSNNKSIYMSLINNENVKFEKIHVDRLLSTDDVDIYIDLSQKENVDFKKSHIDKLLSKWDNIINKSLIENKDVEFDEAHIKKFIQTSSYKLNDKVIYDLSTLVELKKSFKFKELDIAYQEKINNMVNREARKTLKTSEAEILTYVRDKDKAVLEFKNFLAEKSSTISDDTKKSINTVFKKLLAKNHPDKGGDVEEFKRLDEINKTIQNL